MSIEMEGGIKRWSQSQVEAGLGRLKHELLRTKIKRRSHRSSQIQKDGSASVSSP